MENKWKFINVLLMCILFCISCKGRYDIKNLFPENISTLSLIKLVKGEKAIKMVNRLHGKPIEAKNAWIAYYRETSGKGNNQAIIWISEAFNSSQAKKQTDLMMRKIMKSKAPFYNIQKIGKIYIFFGLGEKHAVFCRDKLVFWISASPEVFTDVLNYYRNIKI